MTEQTIVTPFISMDIQCEADTNDRTNLFYKFSWLNKCVAISAMCALKHQFKPTDQNIVIYLD